MNATILVTVGVTLIALTGGLFLLTKTNKDNLSLLFRIAAWFIIVVSLLNLGCSAMHCMMGFYGKHFQYEMMMHDKMDNKMHKQFMKGDMWHHQKYDGMQSKEFGRDGHDKDNCMGGCCDGQNGKQDDHWKKCYEQLKDSCLRKEGKAPIK